MFILDHRALQKHQQNISSVQELGAPGSLCFITLRAWDNLFIQKYRISHYKGFRTFFFPKFVWQFGLLIFDFSKRLDGCAVTWICQPALPGHQFALRVSLVEELFPLLSCNHPINQRFQCVLERMFCRER